MKSISNHGMYSLNNNILCNLYQCLHMNGYVESQPYFQIPSIWLPKPFFICELKEIGHEHVFYQVQIQFSARWVSSQENWTLCKTCYFVSKTVLPMIVSVDSSTTSLVSPCSEFFALLWKATTITFTYDWGRWIPILSTSVFISPYRIWSI